MKSPTTCKPMSLRLFKSTMAAIITFTKSPLSGGVFQKSNGAAATFLNSGSEGLLPAIADQVEGDPQASCEGVVMYSLDL